MKHSKIQLFNVIVYPLLISILAVLGWFYLLKENGLYFSAEAETPVLYMILPPVGFIYVIFASLAINSVFDKYKQLHKSITRKDLKEYVTLRDQHLPVLMYILVAVPSLVLLFLVATYQYSDVAAGMASVFLVTLVVSLTWTVIYELDNDHRRPHTKKRTPSDWHEIESEDFFN